VAQLCAGQVDRQRAEIVEVALPGVHLPAGLFQHPVANLQDHAILFGEGNKVFGRYVAKRGVMPADQRFGTDQFMGREAQFGLVVEAQLIALDGAAQFVFECHAFVGLGGEVASIAFNPVAPLGLGAVHRGVGVLDQRGDVGAVLRV